jgi:hypothetical protein
MYKIGKNRTRKGRGYRKVGGIKVYGEPSPVEYRQLTSSMVSGKKPSGWNLKSSSYRVTITMNYMVMCSPKPHSQSRKHHFTVRDCDFSRYGSSRNLEYTLNSILSKKMPGWEATDIELLKSRNMTDTVYRYPASRRTGESFEMIVIQRL